MNYKLVILNKLKNSKKNNKSLINKKQEVFDIKYEITNKLIYKLHSNYIKKYLNN
jgi:hypothetical protein